MYCGKCGNKLNSKVAGYCGKCGNHVPYAGWDESISDGPKPGPLPPPSPPKKSIVPMLAGIALVAAVLLLVWMKPWNTIEKLPDNEVEVANNTKSTSSSKKETSTSKTIGNLSSYTVTKIALDEDDCINENDTFWVTAKDANNQYFHLKVDINNNIYTKIAVTDGYTIIEKVLSDSLLLVSSYNTGAQKLINDSGIDVTTKYGGSNEKYLTCEKDSTGVTVWTTESVDTYDSHTTMFRAYSEDGKLKHEWSSSDLNSKFGLNWDGIINRYVEFKYVGESIYHLYAISATDINLLFNVENGVSILTIDDMEPDIEAVDGKIYAYDKYTGVEVFDLSGKKLFSGSVNYGKQWISADNADYIGEGMFWDYDNANSCHVLIDYMSNKIEIFSDVYGSPRFVNGYAAICIMNSGDVAFSGIIDKNGKMLFEPIKGKCIYSDGFFSNTKNSYLDGIDMHKFELNKQTYLMTKQGKAMSIPNSTIAFVKISGKLNAISLSAGKLNIVVVE